MRKTNRFLRPFFTFHAAMTAVYRKFFPVSRTNSIKYQISVLYTSILGFILVIFSGVL